MIISFLRCCTCLFSVSLLTYTSHMENTKFVCLYKYCTDSLLIGVGCIDGDVLSPAVTLVTLPSDAVASHRFKRHGKKFKEIRWECGDSLSSHVVQTGRGRGRRGSRCTSPVPNRWAILTKGILITYVARQCVLVVRWPFSGHWTSGSSTS